MKLPLPLHYSDLLYKDPDSAVCACMARKKNIADANEILEFINEPVALVSSECYRVEDPSAITPVTQEVAGSVGCGLQSYSPLGTEVWGRSLLVFHSTAVNTCDNITDSADNDAEGVEIMSSSSSSDSVFKTYRLPSGLIPKIVQDPQESSNNLSEKSDDSGSNSAKNRKRKSLIIAKS